MLLKLLFKIISYVALPWGVQSSVRTSAERQTAEMAGISRVLGGYHIQSDNIAGLELGRNVAHEAWKFYLRHIGEDADDKSLSN